MFLDSRYFIAKPDGDGGSYTSGFLAVASGAPTAPATVAGGRVSLADNAFAIPRH